MMLCISAEKSDFETIAWLDEREIDAKVVVPSLKATVPQAGSFPPPWFLVTVAVKVTDRP